MAFSQRWAPVAGKDEVAPCAEEHLDGPRIFQQGVGHVVGDHIAMALSVSLPSLVFLFLKAAHHGRHVFGAAAVDLLAVAMMFGDFVDELVGIAGNFSTGALELCMTPPSVSMEPRMPFRA